MKSNRFAYFSVVMVILAGCASFAGTPPPQLAGRVLDLSKDAPVAIYKWEVCVKKFLGICTKHEIKAETYDLRDPEVWGKLRAMEFVLSVRKKF